MLNSRFRKTLLSVTAEAIKEHGVGFIASLVLFSILAAIGVTFVSVVEMGTIVVFSLAPGLVVTKVTSAVAILFLYVFYPITLASILVEVTQKRIDKENKNILDALGGT